MFLGNGALVVGAYRYRLWRTWNPTRPRLLWILLNPSTADERADDPTVRRCAGFSWDWGYGGLELVNLFALRARDPRELQHATDPVGRDNDRHIVAAATRAAGIIAAWGDGGRYQLRDRAVCALLWRHGVDVPRCLGTTRAGCPRHPLYVARSTSPVPYHANVD